MEIKRKYKDVTGVVYGRLTVLGCVGKGKSHYLWECICECGNKVTIAINNLNSGHTKSCGCLSIEKIIDRSFKHGNAIRGELTGEYLSWASMKVRCLNETSKFYSNYGGRGIGIYQPWIDSFEEFLKYIGPKPTADHSLDRYPNNDGNYEPGNVRWATKKEQSYNRRSNRWYQYSGLKMIMNDWAKKIGIDHRTLSYYLRHHSMEEAYLHYTKNKSNFIPYAFGYIQ